jgi:hypothetical protein
MQTNTHGHKVTSDGRVHCSGSNLKRVRALKTKNNNLVDELVISPRVDGGNQPQVGFFFAQTVAFPVKWNCTF